MYTPTDNSSKFMRFNDYREIRATLSYQLRDLPLTQEDLDFIDAMMEKSFSEGSSDSKLELEAQAIRKILERIYL